MLSRLSTSGNKIVDARGRAVQLRGLGIGGWMNLENFINGYPGAESSLRATMAQALGREKAAFFFERLADHFLAEEDLAFIRGCGANTVRLSLNYRHFESDENPFSYLESGFARLSRIIAACKRQGLYVILDLHSVQGYQNPDWHCDNATRQALFWQHPHFQDRFVALWQEIARRFNGHEVIAGYNIMNEPVTGARISRFQHAYTADWDALNRLYRRTVKAIRTIDPKTIIFLEGDCFSVLFQGLDAPFAENLVYSSHNYTNAGFGPGTYPGVCAGSHWDLGKQEEIFLNHEGTQFAKKHRVPLWVGEFGGVSNGQANERPCRVRAIEDQISLFEAHGAHWTIWTYKDAGVMGVIELDPDSPYMRLTGPLRQLKIQLGTDFWMQWLPQTRATQIVNELAQEIVGAVGKDRIDEAGNRLFLSQATMDVFVGATLQPYYADLFKGMPEDEMDRVLESFAFGRCRPKQDWVTVLSKLFKPERARSGLVERPAQRSLARV